MQIQNIYDYRSVKQTMSIKEAIGRACNDGLADGQIESLRRRAESTEELLGRLVERLHGSRVLSDEDVIYVLGTWAEKVPS